MKHINEIAKSFGIKEDYLELYGKYKAKLSYDFIKDNVYNKAPKGKLILVTAINPTPAGEGKTTVTISLTQGLNAVGKRTVAALREPSLGPCFGMKGGASGGGKSCLLPENELNLHFTGDFHAITSANNLISAVLDNTLHQQNPLNINPKRIVWKRVIDMNDRPLRSITIGLGANANGVMREDGFMISVASEIMAVFCLATDLKDLRKRLSEIIVAYTYDNEPVRVCNLGIVGSLMALLVDAFKPNIIQTTEGNLAVVHGGPFANIAHGCNSVLATRTALSIGDYVITEAGFGADLGAEKFFDIKCRTSGLYPHAVVVVATIRALKFNGGVDKANLTEENLQALENGFVNLQRHVANMKSFGVPVCVAINRFSTDTDAEIELLKSLCNSLDVPCDICDGFSLGGEGTVDLAETIVKITSTTNVKNEGEKESRNYPYELGDSIEEKIFKLAKKFYCAKNVEFLNTARKSMNDIQKMGYGNLPICVAKTPYSFSDNPKLLGAPSDFTITVSNIRLSAGAGMVVLEIGSIMTMPGLPKLPAALDIDIDDDGNIIGMI